MVFLEAWKRTVVQTGVCTNPSLIKRSDGASSSKVFFACPGPAENVSIRSPWTCRAWEKLTFMARCSGVLPSCPLALVRAPCVSSTMAQSKRPRLTMMCKAMSAVLLTQFTSQPYSINNRVICAPKAWGRERRQHRSVIASEQQPEWANYPVLPEVGHAMQ